MATITQNADNSFTVQFSALEQRVLQRSARDSGNPPTAVFQRALEGHIQARLDEYRLQDGRPMREKYDALPPEKQAQVDALLSGK